MGYNITGTLATRLDFNGKTTTFAYDTMNRLLTRTPDASFAAPAISYSYNLLGQRLTMSDVSGVTNYRYDLRNRLLSKATPQGTLSYTYDNGSNLKTVRSSNANGVSTDSNYDVLNRLSGVVDNNQPSGAQTTNYSYDDVGNLASFSTPNDVTHSYTHNTLNRLTNVGVSKTASTLANYAYTLGAAGNRTSVTEQNGRTVNYSYDSLYRLTSETILNSPNPGNNGQVSYTYDPVGNRLSRNSTVIGVPSTVNMTYDANDRLTTDSYDANGNTTGSNGNGYVYDFENRLLKVNAGTASEISIVYDGDGNRVSKTLGGVTTKYLVDTNNLTGYAQVVEELSVVGSQLSVTRQYTYGHDLISQRQFISGAWQTSWYQYDGHGSVRSLTNSAGAVTDTFTYDAFGVLIHRTGTTPNLYLYAGEQYDPDLVLYYNRARYLKAETGRFWTQDSYEGISSDPQSLHKYLYGHGNPISNIDPSGHISVGGLFWGAIGVIATIATIATIGPRVLDQFRSTLPPVNIVDQPVIVEGTGWDPALADMQLTFAKNFWKQQANINITTLPPITVSCDNLNSPCPFRGPLNATLSKDWRELDSVKSQLGITAKHVTFFAGKIAGQVFGKAQIGGLFTLISNDSLAEKTGFIVAHEWGHTFNLDHVFYANLLSDTLLPFFRTDILTPSQRSRANGYAKNTFQ